MLALCLTLLISLTVKLLRGGVFRIPSLHHVLREFGIEHRKSHEYCTEINFIQSCNLHCLHTQNFIPIPVFHF
jgi:hypothetical protein